MASVSTHTLSTSVIKCVLYLNYLPETLWILHVKKTDGPGNYQECHDEVPIFDSFQTFVLIAVNQRVERGMFEY